MISPCHVSAKKNPHISKAIKLSVEPLVKVKKMSKEDILLVQKRVRNEYTKLVPSGNTRKKSAKMNQVKRPVVKNKSRHFNVVVHKLKKQKCKYYYKCKIGECPVSFSKTSAWNVHHLVKHKDVKFRCNECRKVLRTPSSYKNHLNLHKECHFACNRCNHKFVFQSELIMHRSPHKRQKLYSCFAADCNRSYKWRHDLIRHIKVHTKKILYKCRICNYNSYEGRLFRQHLILHTSKTPYKCRHCP